MKRLLGVLALLVAGLCSTGGDYYAGYCDGNYTYAADGYWYYGGVPYTRTWCWYPTTYYYRCGYWYPYQRSGYWSYARYHPVSNYYSSNNYSGTGDFWTDLLSLARNRDSYELALRKESVETASRIKALEALGLGGNFHIEGYGQPYAYPGYPYFGHLYGYGNTNFGTYGANADSLYGYSYSALQNAYGNTDMNTLYQQSSRLAQGAQDFASQATNGHQGLINNAGNNAVRVAEALAKGKAAAEALNAASPAPSISTEQSTSVYGGAATSQGGLAGQQPGQQPTTISTGTMDRQFVVTVLMPTCGQCHSPQAKKLEANLNVLLWPTFTPEQKQHIWERMLLPPGDEHHMPRNSVLTPQQKLAFLINWGHHLTPDRQMAFLH